MSSHPRHELVVAATAAFVATAGDLLMLLVANAQRPELALPSPPPLALPVGAALGVVAIPFYARGYRAVARGIEGASPRRARLIRGCGLGAAIAGAAIHGVTGLAIRASRTAEAGAGAGSPLAAVAGNGLLVAAWAVAAVLVLVASAAIAGAREQPRALRWLNPAAATLLFALAGLPGELGRSFLVPAAPNLGHIAFFFVAAATARGPWPAAKLRRPDPGP